MSDADAAAAATDRALAAQEDQLHRPPPTAAADNDNDNDDDHFQPRSIEATPTFLATTNAHPRDQHILFFEADHRYTITCDPDHTYTSVTTWNHHHFEEFQPDLTIARMITGRNWGPNHKYWGKSPDQIRQEWDQAGKDASDAGTIMHYNIECFHNAAHVPYPYTNADLVRAAELAASPDSVLPPDATPDQRRWTRQIHHEHTLASPEWTYFMDFARDHPEFIPFRTEWLVWHEDAKIAGSIDMVYRHRDTGRLHIYDWKRSKEIAAQNKFSRTTSSNPLLVDMPDSNYWHYALQLNIYKYILESKYDVLVDDLVLVRLHPNNSPASYECVPVPIMPHVADALFAQRLAHIRQEPFDLWTHFFALRAAGGIPRPRPARTGLPAATTTATTSPASSPISSPAPALSSCALTPIGPPSRTPTSRAPASRATLSACALTPVGPTKHSLADPHDNDDASPTPPTKILRTLPTPPARPKRRVLSSTSYGQMQPRSTAPTTQITVIKCPPTPTLTDEPAAL